MINILIGILSRDGTIQMETAGSLYATGVLLTKKAIDHTLYTIMNESFVVHARNRLAHIFMENDFTHLLCIDSDIGFDAADVIKLIDMNCEFAAAVYNIKSNQKRDTLQVSEGVVKYVGLGFSLIARSVFEKIDADDIRPQQSWAINSMMKGYYNPIMINQELLAEDYAFCHRCTTADVTINIDPSIKLIHYGYSGFKRDS